jgi:hypothetical protein
MEENINTASEQNEKPWLFKKGVSPNPAGRPKGIRTVWSLTSCVRDKLEECPKGQEKTYLYYLLEAIFEKAIIKKDEKTIRMIWNYIDGMPRQQVDLLNDGGKFEQPIININFA